MFKFIKYHIMLHKAMKEDTGKAIIELQRKLDELQNHCELFDSMLEKETKAA